MITGGPPRSYSFLSMKLPSAPCTVLLVRVTQSLQITTIYMHIYIYIIYIYIYLSTYLPPTYLSIYLPTYLSTYLSYLILSRNMCVYSIGFRILCAVCTYCMYICLLYEEIALCGFEKSPVTR